MEVPFLHVHSDRALGLAELETAWQSALVGIELAQQYRLLYCAQGRARHQAHRYV